MAFNPTILGLWVCYEENGTGAFSKLSGLSFNRSAKIQARSEALKQKRGVST